MSEEKTLMTKLRTTIPFGDMKSVLSMTKVMRVIKYFPRATNQSNSKLLCYDEYGSIIFSIEFTYLSVVGLRRLLPKRIGLIEDNTYMKTLKEFTSDY